MVTASAVRVRKAEARPVLPSLPLNGMPSISGSSLRVGCEVCRRAVRSSRTWKPVRCSIASRTLPARCNHRQRSSSRPHPETPVDPLPCGEAPLRRTRRQRHKGPTTRASLHCLKRQAPRHGLPMLLHHHMRVGAAEAERADAAARAARRRPATRAVGRSRRTGCRRDRCARSAARSGSSAAAAGASARAGA